MLQEAMVCAHCVQAGLPEELEQVFRMGTYNPAANALIEGYGTEPGCVANLVVHSSPTPDLVIIDQATASSSPEVASWSSAGRLRDSGHRSRGARTS